MIVLFTILLGLGQLNPSCLPDCVVQAAPATSLILVDGVLDEEDWQQATPAMSFLQATPEEGQLTTYKTQVRILHDQRILYVGATLHDPAPHRIRRTLGRRDRFNNADWFSIALDANNDQQTAFHFAVNAAGVRVEGFQVDGTAPSEWSVSDVSGAELLHFDPDWDAEWTAMVRVDSVGWTVEMAIPISLLGITSVRERSWGINFRRWVARAAELSEWALVPLQERNGGTVSRFGTLHLVQPIQPAIHRYGYMYTLVPNYKDLGDERSMTVPIPGADGGLALGRRVLLQASVSPKFYPEDIHEYINDFFLPRFNTLQYHRLFPTSRQLIAFTPSGSNLLFDRLTGVQSCGDLLVGGTSLHGRLPGRVTVAGIGRVYLPQSSSYIPTGFTGRIQKDIGAESRIGISGTMEPVNPESNQSTNPLEGVVSAASMDWNFRNQHNSARWTGQVGVSQIKNRNHCEDDPLRSQSDQDHLPSEVYNGVATRVEYGQLGKAYNWFARIKIIHPDFVAPPIYQRLLPDRIEVTAGFRHAYVRGSGIIKKGQFNVALSQWRQYSNFNPEETILTGQAAALTSKYNVVSLAIHAGIQSSGDIRFGADASASTDIRRRLALTPRMGLTWIENGLRISHGSMNLKGSLGTRLTLDMQIMATHASGNMDSRTWLSEFLAREPTFTTQRDDMHALVQCHSSFGVDDTRAKTSNCVRAHAFASVGLFRTLDFELGVHALGIGTTDHLNRQVIADARTDLVGELRWEFKPRAVFRLGANLGKYIRGDINAPDWKHIFDLLTAPIDTKNRNYHLLSFSIARRWQR